MPVASVTASRAARFFSQYAKKYYAGAFATPLAKDLERAIPQGLLHYWQTPGDVVGLEERITGVRTFTDFLGVRYPLAINARVLRYLAVADDATCPRFDHFQYVYAYMEDGRIVDAIRLQGFQLLAVKVSPASEIIGLFWRGPATQYQAEDAATLTELPLAIPARLREQVCEEVSQVRTWRDDDPYYHKGEWSQISLRGYKPEDPSWGVKPAEMSRAWKAQHPEASGLTRCDWTTLARQTPALRSVIAGVSWWHRFERIRLLRLTQGQLTRHTDITDRSAGTRDNQISRFHIPLITHPDVFTQAWDLQGQLLRQHWEPWHLYYLDQRKPHYVKNPSTVARIHLVVDVLSDAAVRRHLAQGYQATLIHP